jgi:hypothetical protein
VGVCEAFLRALRQLPESEWQSIGGAHMSGWEMFWEEEVGVLPSDEIYVDAVGRAGIHDPAHLVRAIAEAASGERRAEAEANEVVAWAVLDAELAGMAKGEGPPRSAASLNAGRLSVQRIDWEQAVNTAVRAARALAVGHRISEEEFDFALGPFRHVIDLPAYEQLR